MNIIMINIYQFVIWIWDFLKENHQIINAFVLFLTMLVVIWYAFETHKMRITNEKNISLLSQQLELEKQKNEPNVIACFDNGVNIYSILFVLSNEGGSTAKNVRVGFEPTLDFGNSVFKKYFENSAVLKTGVDIQPRGKYVIKVGNTQSASSLYKENKIPTNYKVVVTYSNFKHVNSQKVEYFDLTIGQFFYRLDPEGKTLFDQELGKINENLEKIAVAINDKNESSNEIS